MSRRGLAALLITAWVAWTLWVALSYFVIPDDPFVVLHLPVTPAPYWREALTRFAVSAGGAATLVLAAWGAGRLASRPWSGLFETSAERLVFPIALGFAVLSWVFLLLGFAGAYHRVPVIVVTVVAAAAGVFSLISLVRGARLSGFRPRLSGSELIYLLCAGAALGFGLIGALAPEIEYDALWYHLWLPVKWLEAGGPVDPVEEYISLYPLAWELLNGAAMAIAGPVAAKLLHFVCLPLLGFASAMLTRRLFPGASPMLACAVTVATPMAVWEASTAYVDLALALYVALAACALVRYDDTGGRRWLLLAAVLAGTAMSIKHLGLVSLAIMAGVVAVREVAKNSRPLLSGRWLTAAGRVTLFVAIACLPALPWYIRAFAASGNPVFPDLYAVFGAAPDERWTAATEQALDRYKERFGPERTLTNLLRLPWDMTVHAASYGGTFGPVFLMLVPFAVVRRGGPRRLWIVAGACLAYLAIWASPISSFQMRFLMPILPLMAALVAESAARLQRASAALDVRIPVLVTATLAALLAFNLPPLIAWHERDRIGWTGWLTHVLRDLPLPVIVGAEREADYLGRTVRSYRAWQFANDRVEENSLILTFSGGDHLYSRRPRVWSDATVAREATWGAAAGDEERALHELERLGTTHVLLDRRQLADGTVSALAIGSERMRACCLELLYGDSEYALYRVKRARPSLAADSETKAGARLSGP